jgi:hypothetical protein
MSASQNDRIDQHAMNRGCPEYAGITQSLAREIQNSITMYQLYFQDMDSPSLLVRVREKNITLEMDEASRHFRDKTH